MNYWKVKPTKSHQYYILPLSTRVLLVANVNHVIGDFAVYIDAVKGINHEDEWEQIAKTGTKVDKELAIIYFTDLFRRYTWRV